MRPLLLLICIAACDSGLLGGAPTPLRLSPLPIACKHSDDWTANRVKPISDRARGGQLASLTRRFAPTGSPRVDIAIEPLRARQTDAAALLKKRQAQLSQTADSEHLEISASEFSKARFAGSPASRLTQSYLLGAKTAPTRLSITQVTTVAIQELPGDVAPRTIITTAVGRTELLTPLLPELDTMLESCAISPPSTAN